MLTKEQSLERALAEVKRLRAVLEEVRAFSKAHHSDERSHVWLHALIVDIPAVIDEALKGVA